MDQELERRLNAGIIIIDKPRGPSSHEVGAWVAKMIGVPAGHGGTLDPKVSGVLAVMTGRAVKLAPLLLNEDKEYIALLRLHGDVQRSDLERVIAEYTGKIYQRPPQRSAVSRQLRIREIYAIDILDVQGRLVLMRVQCEAGTYIRSLCRHIGLSLGVGGHMQELRRTRSGLFSEQDTCTLYDLKDAAFALENGDPAPLLRLIRSPDEVAAGLPSIVIRDTAVDAICHGAVLAGVGVVSRDPHKKGDEVAVLTAKGELVCIGTALVPSDDYEPGATGLVVRPTAVIMATGTYPPGWKKHRVEGD
jgi:H/ACA ribonucleoprotein complex subunit 4